MSADDTRRDDAIETVRREIHELITGVHARIDERIDGVHVRIEGVHDHIRLVAESAASRDDSLMRKLDEAIALNRAEHETFKNVLLNHEGRIATLEQSEN
jgi:hypothetical protein